MLANAALGQLLRRFASIAVEKEERALWGFKLRPQASRLKIIFLSKEEQVPGRASNAERSAFPPGNCRTIYPNFPLHFL